MDEYVCESLQDIRETLAVIAELLTQIRDDMADIAVQPGCDAGDLSCDLLAIRRPSCRRSRSHEIRCQGTERPAKRGACRDARRAVADAALAIAAAHDFDRQSAGVLAMRASMELLLLDHSPATVAAWITAQGADLEALAGQGGAA